MVRQLGQTKVSDHNLGVFLRTVEQQVLWLQIPVHYAVLVKIADGLQHLSDDLTGILLCVHSPVYDPVKQLPPGNPEGRTEADRWMLRSHQFQHRILELLMG